jgi:hypothetical protein
MGLFRIFRDAWSLSVHDSLSKQLTELKDKGMDDVQAGAVLIIANWQLPNTEEMLTRAMLLSKGLGE